MADVIKMDYQRVEEAIQVFSNGGEHLEDVRNMAVRIANILDEGALWGQGGQAYSSALHEQMNPALERMRAKFDEIVKDLRENVELFQETDTDVSQYYA